MTIPWLMNCGHSDDGWCLDCVKEQHAELDRYRQALERIADAEHNSGYDRVLIAREALKDA